MTHGKNIHVGDANIPNLDFTLKDIRKEIPQHCFNISTIKGIRYFLQDYLLIAFGYLIKEYFSHNIITWIMWNILQGFFFWCLFVVGHDCGHRVFSKNRFINDLFGHLSHAPLLVPYHSWRITHRYHHKNHNHAEKEAAWKPKNSEQYKKMVTDKNIYYKVEHFFRYTPFLNLIMFPYYLISESNTVIGNHFNPFSPIFRKIERNSVAISSFVTIAWFVLMCYIGYLYGTLFIIDNYFAPWLTFTMWLSLVTYLHHTDEDAKFYRGKTWNYLIGGLETVDRTYGFGIDKLMHDVSIHVVHHLFYTQVPHYHLIEATEAIKPILGKHYKKVNTFFLKSYWDTVIKCHFIASRGEATNYNMTF